MKRYTFPKKWRKTPSDRVVLLTTLYSTKYSVDARLMFAQTYYESAFDPLAVSKAGASGIRQMLPNVFKYDAMMLGIKNPNLFDLEQNLQAGIYEFSLLQNYFLKHGYELPEAERFALASYNWGLGNVIKCIQKHNLYEKVFKEIEPHLPEETRKYVDNITRDRSLIEEYEDSQSITR